ncbi:hypothetical protein M3Y96_00358800 [Aphelenchoides besseyi]|nr:hypothetical protein M3Y96_00358800 [Aphelenchoides besseyi]
MISLLEDSLLFAFHLNTTRFKYPQHHALKATQNANELQKNEQILFSIFDFLMNRSVFMELQNPTPDCPLHGIRVENSSPTGQTILNLDNTAPITKYRNEPEKRGFLQTLGQTCRWIGRILHIVSPPLPHMIITKASFTPPDRGSIYFLIYGPLDDRRFTLSAKDAFNQPNITICLRELIDIRYQYSVIFTQALRLRAFVLQTSLNDYIISAHIPCRHSIELAVKSPKLIILCQPNSSDLGNCICADPTLLGGLILLAPFISVMSVIPFVSRFSTKDRFCRHDRFLNYKKIKTVRCRTFFAHGLTDALITAEHTKVLSANCPNAVTTYYAENIAHQVGFHVLKSFKGFQELYSDRPTWEKVRDFTRNELGVTAAWQQLMKSRESS